MVCFEINKNSFNKVKDIGEYLHIGCNNNVLSIVGAGGKTSILYYIANMEGIKGKKVVAMTSTKMYKPEKCFISEPEFCTGDCIDIKNVYLDNFFSRIDTIKKTLGWNYYVIGKIDRETKKLRAPSKLLYSKLIELNDVVVIEADGSKRKPVKFPRLYEPIIYPETTVCLIVMGLSGLGQTISSSCARVELVCKCLGKNKEETLNEEDYAKIINIGYINRIKSMYSNIKIVPIINQIDNFDMILSVKKIAKFLDMSILGSMMECDERKDSI